MNLPRRFLWLLPVVLFLLTGGAALGQDAIEPPDRSGDYFDAMGLFLLPNRRGEAVNKAIRQAVSECPVRVRALTVDNGKEFAGHRELRAQTNVQVYFTDPYCAYQKGTVEHFIGVLRRKLPKRTDFSN